MEGTVGNHLNKKEVCKRIKLAPAQLDRLERRGKFPKRFSLSDLPNGKAYWWEDEVLGWLASRPRKVLRPLADDSV